MADSVICEACGWHGREDETGCRSGHDEFICPACGALIDTTIGNLRRIAADWHGGQGSPLYAFASSGHIYPAGMAQEAYRDYREEVAQGRRPRDLRRLHTFAMQCHAYAAAYGVEEVGA